MALEFDDVFTLRWSGDRFTSIASKGNLLVASDLGFQLLNDSFEVGELGFWVWMVLVISIILQNLFVHKPQNVENVLVLSGNVVVIGFQLLVSNALLDDAWQKDDTVVFLGFNFVVKLAPDEPGQVVVKVHDILEAELLE